MCTAVNYKGSSQYFGRTLDISYSYDERVIITPRKYEIKLRHRTDPITSHYAIVGMAAFNEDFPLYYDAMNEAGLAMAGLNFPYNSTYFSPDVENKVLNIASFELIPYVLSLCDSADKAKRLIQDIIITDIPFNKDFPPAPLHWIVSDKKRSIVIEQTKEGLKVYDNPVGVLTNNPPFPYHIENLINYTDLSSENPVRTIPDVLKNSYSFGLGTLSLPGDFSSISRFVRACYVSRNSVPANTERLSVNRFFDILASVSVPYGCVKNNNGDFHYTIYSSCCNLDKGIYYHKTHDNNRIRACQLQNYDLDTSEIILTER